MIGKITKEQLRENLRKNSKKVVIGLAVFLVLALLLAGIGAARRGAATTKKTVVTVVPQPPKGATPKPSEPQPSPPPAPRPAPAAPVEEWGKSVTLYAGTDQVNLSALVNPEKWDQYRLRPKPGAIVGPFPAPNSGQANMIAVWYVLTRSANGPLPIEASASPDGPWLPVGELDMGIPGLQHARIVFPLPAACQGQVYVRFPSVPDGDFRFGILQFTAGKRG